MNKQTAIPKAHIYRPEITFEDTNLVGNVYFANYVRWQNECRDHWFKETDPTTYASVFNGTSRICVTELSLEFSDPVGATLGDAIEVGMNVERTGASSYIANSSTRRSDCCPENGKSALATGFQRFELLTNDEDIIQCNHEVTGEPDLAFNMLFPVPMQACSRHGRLSALDMIRWQGKCREQFLGHHAPGMLQFIADRTLALHTTRLSLQLLLDIRVMAADYILLEMRLRHLRGGRLSMHFNYFVSETVDGSTGRQLVATGSQSVCCKRLTGHGLAPAVFPAEMLQACRRLTNSTKLRANIDDAIEFARNDSAWSGVDRTAIGPEVHHTHCRFEYEPG